eukprot:676067-Lingulodinium_polyedra.AAC.1
MAGWDCIDPPPTFWFAIWPSGVASSASTSTSWVATRASSTRGWCPEAPRRPTPRPRRARRGAAAAGAA